MKGKIKFFKVDKGYGFIEIEGEKDLFCHMSDFLDKSQVEFLKKDDKVEFEKGWNQDMDPKAVKIVMIGEEND